MPFFQFSGEGFQIHHSRDTVPNPDAFFIHVHGRFELFYFISGEATFWVEGTPYQMHPQDLMLFNTSEAHKIDVLPTTPYERVAIHFDKDLFSAIDPQGLLVQPFLSRGLGQSNRLQPADFADTHCRHCLQGLLQDAPDRTLQTLSNLLPLLNEIRIAFANRQKKTAVAPTHLAVQIVNYINTNIQNELTPEKIAQEFFISRSQLYTLFRETTGSAVWEYITAKRLTLAKELLQSGEKPTAVYLQCGFRDYTAFYRAYKKRFGVPPKTDLR